MKLLLPLLAFAASAAAHREFLRSRGFAKTKTLTFHPRRYDAIYMDQWRTSPSLNITSLRNTNTELKQVDQGKNRFIRVPPSNSPITDVNSSDMTCNVNGLSGANVETATVPSGATITYDAPLTMSMQYD